MGSSSLKTLRIYRVLQDRGQDLIKYQVTSTEVHERLYKFLLDFAKLQLEAFAAQKKLCEKYAVDSEKYFGTTNTFGSAINEFLRVTQLLVDTEGLVANSFELQGGNDVKQAIKSERHGMKRWKRDRYCPISIN
ncbi:hypothetical protein X801_01691 [Opisthorchis viverrini]|uniref:Uncharacterized protein n=1 Tax=Opisthorchis viverrini TaxID=6198 RepID=A0A1S8X6T6_OPIVI|nr:hypothetical protein X801_01691 [Opisthorchis viverrini]